MFHHQYCDAGSSSTSPVKVGEESNCKPDYVTWTKLGHLRNHSALPKAKLQHVACLVLITLFLFTPTCLAQVCSQLSIVHKNVQFEDGTELRRSTNISNTACVQQCCQDADCTAIKYQGFLSVANESVTCILYTCDRLDACRFRQLSPDQISADGQSISIDLRRHNSTVGYLFIPFVSEETTTMAVESNKTVSMAGMFGSCSTPVGIAIFIGVFCCAINVGLVVSLLWHQRSNAQSYDTASGLHAHQPNNIPLQVRPSIHDAMTITHTAHMPFEVHLDIDTPTRQKLADLAHS